jgi:DNA helicase-2/ATP-dependent DNA helicase PcrA
MNTTFAAAYNQLNAKQKLAVDSTEGPVLVLAGPGTGKTQLLSTRAANIVQLGSVSAQNILCLTYTEAGSSEMRQRITKIMGVQGSDVAVHTFHSFGTWVIGQYQEYFASVRALSPLDDLGRFHVLESLLGKLPLRHQLAVHGEDERFVRQHAVADAIQAFKREGLSPEDLRSILKDNEKTLTELEPLLDAIFEERLSKNRLGEITNTIASYQAAATTTLGAILLETLLTAVDESEALGKTSPLGDWRNAHTEKQKDGRVFKSQATARVLHDTVDLYESYQKQLAELGRYDYEDMVLWAAEALETDDNMRLDVAERYQYIMVDEYQDTNGAQNRLLNALLAANAVDAPNVLVVGDDDQAIMRFQGAEISGTLQFIEQYKPNVVVLEDNYRSTQPILDAARQVIIQTDERLEMAVPELGITKELTSHNGNTTSMHHLSYGSPTAQYAAVATHIKQLIGQGIAPQEIAVIGRKHAELKLLVPYLNELGIEVAYDGKESILDRPAILQLIQFAALIEALANRPKQAQTLLPQVLAAPYWSVPPLDIYHLAATARQENTPWLDAMLVGENARLKAIAEWLIAASGYSKTHNFTQTLDLLIGRATLSETDLKASPYKSFLDATAPEAYATLLSNLIKLREAILSSRPTATGLADLLAVVEDYRRSNTRLVDDNPILRGDATGVQLMSAHGAKGREFEQVIILSVLDTVWGSRARANHQRIRLPENLPLYPAGDATADKLRLLYVAMTRAKSSLLITSYTQSDEGRTTTNVSYLQGDWAIPEPQPVTPDSRVTILETAWSPAEPPSNRSLHSVLEPLLRDFALSPSSLKSFLDFRYSGPLAAVEAYILKFPAAYNANSALGTAAHHALHSAYKSFAAGKPYTTAQLLESFDEKLASSGLADNELESVRQHGHKFLPDFTDRFTNSDFASITNTEEFLRATLPSGVNLSGALDAIKQDNNSITVIDYKTGLPPLANWETRGLSDGKKTSLHFYRQQLLFYKLLVENSRTYKGKQTVTCGELVFVEPDTTSGEYIRLSITDFTPEELTYTQKLIDAVHKRIVTMELPDTSGYSQDLKGILAFEADLLAD